MIKINLLAETQQGKGRVVNGPRLDGGGAFGKNILMSGVVVLAVLFVSWRWYSLAVQGKWFRASPRRPHQVILRGEYGLTIQIAVPGDRYADTRDRHRPALP